MRQVQSGYFPPDWEECVYARYCVANDETNQQAIQAAHIASQSFRYTALSKRRRIFDTIHKLLLNHREEIIKLMIIEGHPRKLAEWEFLGMDTVCRKETIDLYKSELVKNLGNKQGERTFGVRKADGVVCVSPPKNAPCSNSIIGAHALLGGNTLIVKPPLHCPISTIYLWRNVIHEAVQLNDAPNGTINIVLGNSRTITDEWLTSPHVNDLLFFGDSTHGLEIGCRAFQAGKKPILELSGNDLLLVWKDADLDAAVDSLLDGFLGSTQICMVPKKGLIHEDIYDSFERKFVQKTLSLTVGLPSDSYTCLTPVTKISEFYETLEDAIEKGAELLCGARRVDYRGQSDSQGIFITPAVLRILDFEKALSMKCTREENFFPLIPLIRVSSENRGHLNNKDDGIFLRMVGLVNSNVYGLRVSVWVRSRPYLYKFLKRIDSGGLLRINTRHVGFSTGLSSHGGTGKTGGPYGEMNYVWQKTTHLQGITINGV